MAIAGMGDVAKALEGITNAVKTANHLQQNRDGVIRIVQETKKHAEELSKVKIEDNDLRSDLETLRDVMTAVTKSGGHVLRLAPDCATANRELEKNVKSIMKMKRSIPPEKVSQLCKQLEKVHENSSKFPAALVSFSNNLENAQGRATQLSDKLKEKAEEAEDMAKSKESSRNWTTGGLVAAGLGLGALTFFTGGLGLGAAAAVGVGAGATAGAAHHCLTKDTGAYLRKQAKLLTEQANALATLANDIQRNCDAAQGLKLNEKFVESLGVALEHYKAEEEKNQQLVDKDAEIAMLKAKMRAAGIN